MKARIVDFLFISPTRQRLTLDLDGDFRGQIDELTNRDVDVSIKRYYPARSLDANAYLWVLCGLIAKKLNLPKEEVYRQQIREMGDYTPLPIKDEAVESFSRLWGAHGVGWFCEDADKSKLEGYTLVFAYAGSSTYDTQQMHRLIDSTIEEAKSLGIETRPKEEIESMLKEWKGK